MIPAIRHCLEITPTLASSGQPDREQFRLIRDAGYQIVINLALPTSDHAIADEAEVVKETGMEYFHIPVDWDDPEPAHFILFTQILQANSASKIRVHCALNRRISAFLYLYHLLVEGWQQQDARALLNRIWEPNDTWERFF